MRFLSPFICALTILLAVVGGCGGKAATTAPSDATVVGNQANASVSASVPKVAEASRQVLTDMHMSVVQYRFDNNAAQLVAYTPSSERTEVEIRRADSSTHITVRADGKGGDKLSAGVLAAIRKAL